MTQENKELLLKDLCARLPYGVLCEDMEGKTRPLFGITPTQHFILTLDNATDRTNGLKFCTIDYVKPYLRPMSSMTIKEIKEYSEMTYKGSMVRFDVSKKNHNMFVEVDLKHLDWLNSHHFDYRGLIEKGLALEAPDGMYKEWTSIRGNLKEDKEGNIVGGLKL